MRTILALALPALALAGCDSYRGLDPLHQPVVSQDRYALDVATANGRLAPGEAGRVAGWMNAMQLGFGDQVMVDDPNAYDAGVRADVAAQAARFGLLLSDAPLVAGAPVAPGTARVIVTRATATVPGCPDFRGETVPNLDEHTTPNFGCATNKDIAAMVADPEDLVRGQAGTGRYDAATGYKAIDNYRKATATGAGNTLKTESTGGK